MIYNHNLRDYFYKKKGACEIKVLAKSKQSSVSWDRSELKLSQEMVIF